MLEERPESFRRVGPPNLLPRLFTARHVTNRHFVDAETEADRLRRHLGTKFKSLAFQVHGLQDIAADRLIAGCLVRDATPIEDGDRQPKEDIDDLIGQSHIWVEAPTEPRSVDNGFPPRKNRLSQGRKLLGGVLQVCILDHDDLAARVL